MNPEHAQQWESRIQDWVDGTLEPTERAVLDTHLAHCPDCRSRRNEIVRIDRALQRALGTPALGPAFDRHLLAQVTRLDASRRNLTRQRLEREFAEHLQALSRVRRQRLLLMLPAMIAGVALAFAVVACLRIEAAFTAELPQIGALGHDAAVLVNALIAACGASIGALSAFTVTNLKT